MNSFSTCCYLQNILWSKHDFSIPGNYIFAEIGLFEGMVGQMSEATFGPLYGVALCIKMYMIYGVVPR